MDFSFFTPALTWSWSWYWYWLYSLGRLVFPTCLLNRRWLYRIGQRRRLEGIPPCIESEPLSGPSRLKGTGWVLNSQSGRVKMDLNFFRFMLMLVTALGSSDGCPSTSMFPHTFACCSPCSRISSWPFRYQFHERAVWSELIFNIVANIGRKIGMQATTNPKFRSNLNSTISDFRWHSKNGKNLQWTQHERNVIILIIVSHNSWAEKRRILCRYWQVVSKLSGFNVTLLPIPQAAVLPSHQYHPRKWHDSTYPAPSISTTMMARLLRLFSWSPRITKIGMMTQAKSVAAPRASPSD